MSHRHLSTTFDASTTSDAVAGSASGERAGDAPTDLLLFPPADHPVAEWPGEFGITDELAQGVGLACGGNIEVYLERIDPITKTA